MIDINDDDIYQVQSILDVKFDAKRQLAIKSFNDVQACPGSGKTTMVAAKLLIIAMKWKHSHRGVCVLTHTNVAKKEIIDRLKQSADGKKLLSYPHFIGTIQEFVNKFLAIPYLRSSGYQINTIDDDVCSTKGWGYLKYGTKSHLERKKITSLYGMEYELKQGDLKLSVPGFSKESNSDSYRDLVSAKERLMEGGFFYYRDMYAFAKHYLLFNCNVKSAVRSRFPIVLIDEMQDTQRFQDELLNDIFLNEQIKIQRFGDPDQAIYSGTEEENQTYNQIELEKVENSHRFDNSIALLAKNLSFNRIDLNSGVAGPNKSSHTIFLVDEKSRSDALGKFAELCEIEVPIECAKPIKAVGAIGLRKDDGLTICSYVASYDKGHSANYFKPGKLIHYFHESRKFESIHESYSLILEGIAKYGQISSSKLTLPDGNECWYSSSNIRKYLKATNQLVNFNTLIKSLMESGIEEGLWTQCINDIKNYFQLNETDDPMGFLDFDNSTKTVEHAANPNQIAIEVNGRKIEIEVATIHSVKGETHAATLVLETKHYQFDMGQLIGCILGECPRPPTGVRKQKFMKQLYVAFSRPRHLLCLAMDKSRFPDEHIDKAEYAGWKIVDLTT